MIKEPPENELNSVNFPVQSKVVSIYTQTRVLDPIDNQFDFSLWARVVKQQMLAVVERKN